MIKPNSKILRNSGVGLCFILITAVGISYQNCGNINDEIQTQLESTDSEQGIHQKIFIDVVGEKNPNSDGSQTLNATVTLKQITAGKFHSCALRSNGSIKCWGKNDFGQLGNNSTIDSNLPVLANIGGIKHVDAGVSFTCAVMNAGTVKCWGKNDFGQLGNGTTTNSLTPVPVSGITNAVSVSAGQQYACALLSNSQIKCWGKNNWGQLGNGTSVSSSIPVTTAGINNAIGVSVDIEHTCAVLTTNQVKCWGQGNNGQLGQGSYTASSTPLVVPNLLARQVSVGKMHTCALTADAKIKCWGFNGTGEIGSGVIGQTYPSPMLVPNFNNLKSIASGNQFSCAITSIGLGKCWGYNAGGQVGSGSSMSSVTIPETVYNLSNVSQIDHDGVHACGLANGIAYCWGYNDVGQLGSGTTGGQSNVPVAVQNL